MKLRLYLIGILLVFISVGFNSCGSVYDLNKLTLVENPIEFQNPNFPLHVGNQWTYEIRKADNYGTGVYSGKLEFRVADYRYADFYLGDSLVNAPLFRIEGEMEDENGEDIYTQDSYALKAKEGIVFTMDPTEDLEIEVIRFVPNSPKYFKLFKEVNTASIIEKNNISPEPLLELVEKSPGIMIKTYYEENIGEVKMTYERYDKTNFKSLVQNEYILKNYIVK